MGYIGKAIKHDKAKLVLKILLKILYKSDGGIYQFTGSYLPEMFIDIGKFLNEKHNIS